MKVANIAELKNQLSKYLGLVERGEEIEVRKRNVPIARLIPLKRRADMPTRLGSGSGTVKIRGRLTERLIPNSAWKMLEERRR